MEELVALGRALEGLGPYGLLGAVLVAVRRVYRDLKSVNERVLKLTEQQTAVMARVDASLLALRDAILIANARAGVTAPSPLNGAGGAETQPERTR